MEEADLLRLLLTDQNTPCPACRYNLRDLQSNICPECGKYLTTHELFPDPVTRFPADWVNALHLFNIGTICVLGMLSCTLVLNSSSGFGLRGYGPAILLLVCFVAAFFEIAKIGRLLQVAPLWGIAFNPLSYFLGYAGLSIILNLLHFR